MIFMETLLNLTFSQKAGWCAVAVAVLSVFIEFTPYKINPVSMVLNWIGKKINHDISIRINSIEEKVSSMDEKVDTMQDKEDKQAAISARARILRFGEEVIRGEKHTKGHFDSVLKDCKEYENYCKTHEDFENGVTEPTVQIIREVYHDRLVKNDFL